MPNNVKTSYLKETKKLNHILTWILKRLKKKKGKIFKKKACGDSRQFYSQFKTLLPVTFLFMKRFLKTLHQNVRLNKF